VNVTGLRNFTIDKEIKELLVVNLTLNTQSNCDLFKSCKKTRYASELPLLNNAIGFTSFQVNKNKINLIFIIYDF
jgi:hypothetical protein